MAAIDTQRLGSLTANMMENIEKEHPDAELGEVIILCELQTDEGESTTIRTFSSSDKAHIQIGILRLAQIVLESHE